MWTIIGIAIGVLIFLIGLVIGKVSATEPLPSCCLKCLHTHNHDCMMFSPYCCDHFGIRSLWNELQQIRVENKMAYERGKYEGRMQEIKDNEIRYSRFMSATDQERFVKQLSEAMIPLEELKHKLEL